MPDIKLQIAMAEIKAVLLKHDIAAVVVLASQTHSEFLAGIEPTWSIAKFQQTDAGYGVRFRSKPEDFASKAEQDARTHETVGMLTGLRDGAASTFRTFDAVLVRLTEHMDITGTNRREERSPESFSNPAQQSPPSAPPAS